MVVDKLSNPGLNPKDAIGTKKAPMSTVPSPVLMELGLAMLEGACKYSRHNFRIVGVRTSVYYDAALRHLFSFWEGEDIDPDSGLPHIVKAMACLAVLRDSQMIGNVVDDRPPPHKHDWQKELNEAAAKLIDKYPNPKEAHIRDPNVQIKFTEILPDWKPDPNRNQLGPIKVVDA